MALLLNEQTDEEYVKATLYGKSGSGKTTIGCTAPRPLILLSERQGFRSVRDAARRLGIEVPPTIWIQSLSDLLHVLRALQSDPVAPIATALRRVFEGQDGVDVDAMIASLPYDRPESLIVDSTTDMFSLISLDIERTAGKKVGRDGLEAKPERYWGVLRDRSEKMIRSFRDLPYHVFFLALLKDGTIGEGDEQSRVVEPQAPMKALPSALAAAVNLVGIVSVAQEPKKIDGPDGESVTVYEYRRWVRFAGPEWMMTKSMEPLGVNEPPNIQAWLDTIANEEPTSDPLDLAGVSDDHAARTAPHPHPGADAPADGESPGDDADTADTADSADADAPTADAAPADDAPGPEVRPEARSTKRRRRRTATTDTTDTANN